MGAVNAAREAGLAACRRTIRACRQRHPRRPPPRTRTGGRACSPKPRRPCARPRRRCGPFPAVAYAGFLHDAEKEYAEAVLTAALSAGDPLPGRTTTSASRLPAWLNGLAEAASELRRHLLDRLREGELAVAEELLAAMEDVYDLVVGIDYPDAVTGGLRRSADALRAVLERTRSDLTTTILQSRLQAALERRQPATKAPEGARAP